MDNDGDGVGDACDLDDDNDGILDNVEQPCSFGSTGSWTGSGFGPYNATINGVGIDVVYSTSGNAFINSVVDGSFGGTNFWSESLASATSLQATYWWDTNAEPQGTDIDLPSDDKGVGTITINFSQMVVDPILHIDRLGGMGSLVQSVHQIRFY